MENKIDSSFEREHTTSAVVAIIVCIIIAGISFFGLAGKATHRLSQK